MWAAACVGGASLFGRTAAAHAIANMLAKKYHFTLLAVWTYFHGFAIKDIDLALIPLLQCEPTIKVLSFDAVTTITLAPAGMTPNNHWRSP